MHFSSNKSLSMYIRPVTHGDLQEVFELAQQAPSGLTSLPADLDILSEKIAQSVSSQSAKENQEWQRHLFVLYDPVEHRIVGISGLEKEKNYAPHYSHNDLATIYLETKPIGPTKLGSLLLKPNYRGQGAGYLLSKSRFLYIAETRHLIGEKLHAELRGYTDPTGTSHFWQDIGQHIYGSNFSLIDQLRGSQPEFFSSNYLAPHEIPLSFLKQCTLENIGRVNQETKNAMRMLIQEGFRFTPHIDILDGGPILESNIEDIFIVRKSIVCQLFLNKKNIDTIQELWMISNGRPDNFKACLHPAFYVDDHLQVDQRTLDILEIKSGTKVRATLRNALPRKDL